MIKVTDLRKSFGPIRAVDGVSFELRPGETFGLLGPNGAGKTTTILMLTGALRPDAGSVVVDGGGDPAQPAARRRIGVAPQAVSLYDELTGEENLAFFGRLYGLSGERLKERVAFALSFAGLEDRGRDRVRAYSGGMQRRLNLACALVHDPPALLLDEPTVGVDPQSRNHLFESIEALRKEGRTVLLTTHYIEEAERLCDRVAIMDHGRVLVCGPVSKIIELHGGSSVVEAELRQPPADPSALPGRLEGSTLRVETARPFEALAALSASGADIVDLRVRRPDLETVFLALTGRRLRDT